MRTRRFGRWAISRGSRRRCEKRRSAGRDPRDHRGARGPGSWLRRRNHRAAGRRLGATVLGVDIASNLVAAGNARAQRSASRTAPSRRATRPICTTSRTIVRPRREHLRSDVRAAAVRRGQGDGPRDAARRPDRDGELDPWRPDARRADPQDQRRLLAAASGGVRQPDDVGGRGATSSSGSPPPASRREDLVSSATPTRSTSRHPV